MHLLDLDEDVFVCDIYPLLDAETLLALSQACSSFQRSCLSAFFDRHSISESDIEAGLIVAPSAAPLRALRRSPLFHPIQELRLSVDLQALCDDIKPVCDWLKSHPLIPLIEIQISSQWDTETQCIYSAQTPGGVIESLAVALMANRKVAVVMENVASIQDFRASASSDTLYHTESIFHRRLLAGCISLFSKVLCAVGLGQSHATGSSTATNTCHAFTHRYALWAWVRRISWSLPAQRETQEPLPMMILHRDGLRSLSITGGDQTFPLHSSTFPRLKILTIQSLARIDWNALMEFLSRHRNIKELLLQSYSIQLPVTQTEPPAAVAATLLTRLYRISASVPILARFLEIYASEAPELTYICINAGPETPRASPKEPLDFDDLSAIFEAIAPIPRTDVHITLSLPQSGADVFDWLANSHHRVTLHCVECLILCAEDWQEWDGGLTRLLPKWLGDTFPQLTFLMFLDCVGMFYKHEDEVAFEENVLARCSGLRADMMHGHRSGRMEDGRIADYHSSSDRWPWHESDPSH